MCKTVFTRCVVSLPVYIVFDTCICVVNFTQPFHTFHFVRFKVEAAKIIRNIKLKCKSSRHSENFTFHCAIRRYVFHGRFVLFCFSFVNYPKAVHLFHSRHIFQIVERPNEREFSGNWQFKNLPIFNWFWLRIWQCSKHIHTLAVIIRVLCLPSTQNTLSSRTQKKCNGMARCKYLLSARPNSWLYFFELTKLEQSRKWT